MPMVRESEEAKYTHPFHFTYMHYCIPQIFAFQVIEIRSKDQKIIADIIQGYSKSTF